MSYNQRNNNYRNDRYDDRGNQQQHKRKSGCRFGHGKNGKPYVQGWKVTKRTGMISFLATPYKGTHKSKSQSGNEWENWMVKIEFKDQLRSTIESGMYNPTTHTVHIPSLGLIMKPSTSRGGWIGNPNGSYR